ncbi:hypothetical protein CLCR_07848 [Cladophialophora carrionii]|uniref:Uncharacterized protein n=1 Tax=Cladophialophora carrionii TaxID=86049 RepID=A0A1C1CP74_9EURO|nr:hypothetical protein CLCR_07848 [Cladophialophora carrionii]
MAKIEGITLIGTTQDQAHPKASPTYRSLRPCPFLAPGVQDVMATVHFANIEVDGFLKREIFCTRTSKQARKKDA